MYNALLMRKKTLEIGPPLGFRHSARGGPSQGHKQHPQKTGRDQTCHSGDILADRQTQTHTDKVIIILHNCSHGQSNNTGHLDKS